MYICIDDLSVWFKNIKILKNIKMEFKKHQVSAIVGPSGCGKTTLLKTITRTAELECGFRHQGRVLLAGEDIYQCKNVGKIRRRIGLVFQQPVALPLSIQENVLFGAKYYWEKNKKQLAILTEKCLRQANLWDEVKDKLNQPAAELSGGQKQRLSIARVLAVEPEVLLLDEPCSSLDPASTLQIEQLLLKLSQHMTIILVTHNLFQAKRVAQETFFMLDGQLVESGPTNKIFLQPKLQQTRDFVAGLTW